MPAECSIGCRRMGGIRRKTNGHSTPEQIKPKTNRPKNIICLCSSNQQGSAASSAVVFTWCFIFKMWLEVVFSTTKTLVTHTILIMLFFLKLLQYKSKCKWALRKTFAKLPWADHHTRHARRTASRQGISRGLKKARRSSVTSCHPDYWAVR